MLLVAYLVAFFCSEAHAFQLSMMASSSSPRRNNLKESILRTASFIPPPPGASEVTSSLISQLAIIAVKSRLKEQNGVNCDVSFSSSDLLLNGRVGPVTVRGKSWRSGLGLTCRAIDATVHACELDSNKLMSDRKLSLTIPALGKAMVALNSDDFANFISHPLMKQPAVANDEDLSIKFIKEGTAIDTTTNSVVFFALYAGQKWKCLLQRSPERVASVLVTPDYAVEACSDNESSASALSETLGEFFNNMVFELDGTFLSYRDMMITGKGGIPSVMISLNIRVKKFPSPGLEF